jgi:hypothetical protein
MLVGLRQWGGEWGEGVWESYIWSKPQTLARVPVTVTFITLSRFVSFFVFEDEAWFATTRVNVDVISSILSGILSKDARCFCPGHRHAWRIACRISKIGTHTLTRARARTHTHTHTHKMYMCTHARIHTQPRRQQLRREMLPFFSSKIMRASAFEPLVPGESKCIHRKITAVEITSMHCNPRFTFTYICVYLCIYGVYSIY